MACTEFDITYHCFDAVRPKLEVDISLIPSLVGTSLLHTLGKWQSSGNYSQNQLTKWEVMVARRLSDLAQMEKTL